MVNETLKAFGAIDILFNNAGIPNPPLKLHELAIADWGAVMDVSLRGMFLVGQAVAKRMAADGKGGAIVNMSSTNGLVGEDRYSHYNASKGGVLLLTKTMALELGPLGIRVNCLAPGYIVTPMSNALDSDDRMVSYARDKIPLTRVARPE